MTTETGSMGLSRSLRRRSTDAEDILWAKLRNKHVDGFIFRRQHRIGPYVVDFVCLKKKQVIEVDGSQHAAEVVLESDNRRTMWFESQGYRVLRIWNSEVLTNIEGVVEIIRRYLNEGPPSP